MYRILQASATFWFFSSIFCSEIQEKRKLSSFIQDLEAGNISESEQHNEQLVFKRDRMIVRAEKIDGSWNNYDIVQILNLILQIKIMNYLFRIKNLRLR